MNTARDDLPNDGPRETLRQAQASLSRDERDLETARSATARARALLEGVIRDIETLDTEERRRADELADRMRAAIEKGAEVKAASVAKSSASRAELETRRAALERICAEMAAKEAEAEHAVEAARAAVDAAVKAIMRLEAEKIAERWAEVEREARALRVRLGVRGDPVWKLVEHSEPGLRATGANHRDSEFDLQQQQAVAAPWLELMAALKSDPEARPDFAASDQALEEMRVAREERRAADERYVARLRAEAA